MEDADGDERLDDRAVEMSAKSIMADVLISCISWLL
jgi:hypothetical protein